MAFNIPFALLCDDVRQEVNGKFIAVGIYSSIIIDEYPTTVRFWLLIKIIADETGFHEIRFRIKIGGEVSYEWSIEMEVTAVGENLLPILLQPSQLLFPTKYSAEYFTGDRWEQFFEISVGRSPTSTA